METFEGDSLLNAPFQRNVVPTLAAFGAVSRGDVLIVAPKTACVAHSTRFASIQSDVQQRELAGANAGQGATFSASLMHNHNTQ